MKISEQIAEGRNWLCRETPTGTHRDYSCHAIAQGIAGTPDYYWEHAAVQWYLEWLQDAPMFNGVFRSDSGFYDLSPAERQDLRFLLMCFAELAAIDEGL